MSAAKADTIARLQKEMLSLQGLRTALGNTSLDGRIGSIRNAFPGNSFPLGAVHEFIAPQPEDIAVTGGFIAAILSSLMQKGGAAIWIGPPAKLFPPALSAFGINPDRIIFIHLFKEKEILWAMEEALKCEGLSAVIAQTQELGFTASRRLQLAVEQSKVTGFVIRQSPRNISITTCIARWKIRSLHSELTDGMPGVGFPRWNVELLKVRNGRPGKWEIEFAAGRFRHINKAAAIPFRKKKTG